MDVQSAPICPAVTAGAVSPGLTFNTYLLRTGDAYAVAMAPCRAMMLFQPLTFMMDPGEAEAVAHELLRLADLARNPGTMGGAA